MNVPMLVVLCLLGSVSLTGAALALALLLTKLVGETRK